VSCTGVILAGGGASRFGGAPKGLELVDGRRIIDRVASALRQVADDLLLIANAEGAETWLPGVRTARDVRVGCGALGGVHAALAAAGSDVLLVAWDMPFVTAAVIPAHAYGEHPAAPVGSVGVPLLLVANEQVTEGLAYEITRAVYENKVQLIERGGGRTRLWELPSESELRFPLHAGARQYHHRDEPPRFLDWADTISLALTILVLVYSAVAALRTQRQLRRKERVDKFYARLQQVSDVMERTHTEAELLALQRALHEIRRQAFSELMAERLQADESFTIFQDYLRTELAEVEERLRQLRTPSAQAGTSVSS